MSSRIGVVAIGRNEGARLRRCLTSAMACSNVVVYVDSASSDDSVAFARSVGTHVVPLDMSVPFSAARARNVGFQRLLELSPAIEYVQFVDGDSEIDPEWVKHAEALLDERASIAVAAGRCRERYPDRTVYNRLCDLEWDTPPGVVNSCGGNAMIRVRAFRGVGGFNPVVIAGEEPEMCVRLRSAGWNVLRVDAPMTLHDADMHYFGQWWRRAVRSGYAFAEGAWMHGGKPERHCVRESLSIWFWAAAVPLATLALARPTSGWSLLLLLGYGILAWRISRYARRRNWAARDALLYTFFILLGKIPQLVGQTKYFLFRAIGRRSRIIEYKAPRPTAIRKPAQPFQESH